MIDQQTIQPNGAVTIAVFNTVPSGGWLLYFSGVKRPTVTSKYYRVHPNADELVAEAIAYLADATQEDGTVLTVRVVGAKMNPAVINELLEKHAHLTHSPEPAPDKDLLNYLFASARNKKASNGTTASEVQKRRSTPLYEAAKPGKVIVSTDASFMPAGRDGNVEDLGGTGWVIGFHSLQGESSVVLGSKSYLPGPEHSSSNAMELHALRDAMEVLVGMDSLRSHVSTVIVYSDSDYAITAIHKRKVESALTPILSSILGHVAELNEAGIKVSLQWTKGHSNNMWNHIAHKMASRGRRTMDHTSDDIDRAITSLVSRNLL